MDACCGYKTHQDRFANVIASVGHEAYGYAICTENHDEMCLLHIQYNRAKGLCVHDKHIRYRLLCVVVYYSDLIIFSLLLCVSSYGSCVF